SRSAERSTQTIRSAPWSRQPATAPSPTMPAPNTTHVDPAWTAAVFIAAPSPVERPHANRQARSSGASFVILARAISGITVYSANVDVPMKCRIGSPSRDSLVVPSGRRPWFCCSRIARQRFVRGSRQCTHSRHCGEKRVTTWSPGATDSTPSPQEETMRLRPRHPSPVLVVALLALFFALGGSAFAISQKVKPQARCQAGAVRGIAIVTGQPNRGIGNVPDQFTTDKSFFGY